MVLTRELATSNSGQSTGGRFCRWRVRKPARPDTVWRFRSRPQMAKLRTLYSSAENEPPVPLVRNWRPPQPIKGRIVKASFKWGRWSSPSSGKEAGPAELGPWLPLGASDSGLCRAAPVFAQSRADEMPSPGNQRHRSQDLMWEPLAPVIVTLPVKVAFLVRFYFFLSFFRRRNGVRRGKIGKVALGHHFCVILKFTGLPFTLFVWCIIRRKEIVSTSVCGHREVCRSFSRN